MSLLSHDSAYLIIKVKTTNCKLKTKIHKLYIGYVHIPAHDFCPVTVRFAIEIMMSYQHIETRNF